MHRLGLTLVLVLGCTSAAVDPPPGSSVRDEPAPEGHPAEPAPLFSSSDPRVPLSDAPWVWAECDAATHRDRGGCPPGPRFDPVTEREWAPAFTIDRPNGRPQLVRRRGASVAWRRSLPPETDSMTLERPRALRCGPIVYAVLDRIVHAEYHVWRFSAESGDPRPGVLHRVHARAPVHQHRFQLGCARDGGLRVFGSIDASGRSPVLYVDEVTPDLVLRASRIEPAALASIEPFASGSTPPASPPRRLRYRVTGGEPRPWSVGLGALASERTGRPRHLWLEASKDDRPQWKVDLGPALSTDVQVVELGASTIVRLGAELVALDLATGAPRWRYGDWGPRGEPRPRGEQALRGCTRCSAVAYDLRIVRGRLALSGRGTERWVNVLDADGRVLVRRTWPGAAPPPPGDDPQR